MLIFQLAHILALLSAAFLLCSAGFVEATGSAACEKTSTKAQYINHMWKIQDPTKFFNGTLSNGTVHQFGVYSFQNDAGSWNFTVTGFDGINIGVDVTANLSSSSKAEPEEIFLYPVIHAGNYSRFCGEGSVAASRLPNNGTWEAMKGCFLTEAEAAQVNGGFNVTVMLRLMHGAPKAKAGCSQLSIRHERKTFEFKFGGLKTLIKHLGEFGSDSDHVVDFHSDNWYFGLSVATPADTAFTILGLYWDAHGVRSNVTHDTAQIIAGIKTAKGRELLFIPYGGRDVRPFGNGEGLVELDLSADDLEQLEDEFALIIHTDTIHGNRS